MNKKRVLSFVELALEQECPSMALEALDEAIRKAPKEPEYYYRRALVYFTQYGDYANAHTDCLACLELNPLHVSVAKLKEKCGLKTKVGVNQKVSYSKDSQYDNVLRLNTIN